MNNKQKVSNVLLIGLCAILGFPLMIAFLMFVMGARFDLIIYATWLIGLLVIYGLSKGVVWNEWA